MIAVIFEVYPAKGQVEEYLDIAKDLKSELEKIEGFISVERFSSLVEEGKYLSLSFWRDEKAIKQWRKLEAHRCAQKKGRAGVFRDYRLRVADVCRDYTMTNREQVPNDSNKAHSESLC
jgi:heme-degrading monooxygenase HmoA